MTPGYSPPEQYGTARTDNRSDVFSLGATLYAALTGAIPEDALARTMGQVSLTPIRRRSPRISRRLAGVIERSLEVRPDDRYQSAEEFKQALVSVRGITSRRRRQLPWRRAERNGLRMRERHRHCAVPPARYSARCAAPLPSI
jgi:serine/threonine protein kinase